MRWRRLLAFSIDWCCMLGWIALVAAVGVSLLALGVTFPSSAIAQNLVGLTVIAPIVVAAAWCESRARGATPGKRALRLAVEHGSARPAFVRALLRNALKLGLPWVIAHAAVFAVVDNSAHGATPAWAMRLLVASYVIPVLWLVSLLIPGGRTIYDRLSSTRVRNVSDDAPLI